MDVIGLEDREAFITADGSSIREFAGIPSGDAANQSPAEATVPPGATTIAHFHRVTEEIYLFTAGAWLMRLGDEERSARAPRLYARGHGGAHGRWMTEKPVPVSGGT